MDVRKNVLTPQDFIMLYQAVGWEAPNEAQVAVALKHSLCNFVCYQGEQAVGMVRLLGDRGMSFYLKDMAILPKWQGKGCGKALLQSVCAWIEENIAAEYPVSLELLSSPGADACYQACGFSCWQGKGMIRMLKRS